ncbi:SGNH/GDSL hydrolase family protein [Corynebacterium callunae]|uniref:SGNH/GDSL hydrolase family protein n=1 Tax=Corynebacterium callunae TaxID=1721 RepID=UPI001FFFDCF2|nr:SGNH/GDSL hydrolase family protein [Corynebacterium callunae]MCK2200471.1 SGNH/GDSL hydrolase family protein [Corynebacterium callunae]
MTTVSIDITNIASSTHPDDRVVFYSPNVRNEQGVIISTAVQEVPLTDGVGTVDLVPGSVVVRFECLGIADTKEKPGWVPEGDQVTLADVIMEWTPALADQAILAILAAKENAIAEVDAEVAAEAEAIRWRYEAIPLETASMSELADGNWRVASTTVATNLGLPALLGTLTVRLVGVGVRTAIFQSEGTVARPTELWVTTALRDTGEWQAWQKMPSQSEIDAVKFKQPAVPIDTTSMSSLPDGQHVIASTTVATNLGLPALLGTLTVRLVGTEIRTAIFQSEGTVSRPTEIWVTSALRTSGTWQAWQQLPTQAALTAAVDAVKFRQGNVGLEIASMSELADGQWGIASNTVSNTLGLPGGVLGTLILRNIGVGIRTATFQTEGTASAPSALYVTSTLRTTGTWQPWKKLAVEGTVTTTSSAPVAPGGLKTVPLALTLGQGAKNAATSGSHRIPFKYVPEIARYRLGFSLRNTRSNLSQGTGVVVSAAIGDHTTNGAFAATPTTVMTNVTVPDDGSAVYSAWVGADIGSNIERLLAYTYTSTTAPYAMVGGGWTAGTATITDLTPTTTKVLESPLNIWLEVEVESTVPVLGIIGDSITCGVGTSIPVYESWGNLYARSIGGLAILWGMSGDTAAKWVESSTQYKVTRWDGLDNPDAIVWAMGRNDFSNGSTAAAVKAMTETALSWALQKSRRVYAAAITPRDSGLGDAERALHNEWLRTKFSGVLDFDVAIGDPAGGIIDGYTTDGLHPTTSGAAAMVASITRPMTAVRL